MKKSLQKICTLLLVLILLSQQVSPAIAVGIASTSGELENKEEEIPYNDQISNPSLPESISNVNFKSSERTSESSAFLRKRVTVTRLLKKVFSAKEQVKVVLLNASEGSGFTVKVLDSSNQKADILVQEKVVGEEKELTLSTQSEMRPGKYFLVVEDQQGTISKQEFVWGVLAINTDRDAYLPGEKAEIAIAVLDNKGEMVCDAAVILEITGPDGEKDTLSTEKGDIIRNPACYAKKLQLIPDYETEFTTKSSGKYGLKLTAETKNGTYSIEDTFSVSESIPYRIKRSTATRLYPPETYPVNISFTPDEDFDGVITEIVPESFTVSSYDGESSENVNSDFTTALKKPQIGDAKVLSETVVSVGLPFAGVENSSTESGQLLQAYPQTLGFGEQLEDPILKVKYSDFGVIGHDGIDFSMDTGTSIVAVDSGVVGLSEENSDYGTTIVIQHTWGKSYYGHLSELKVAKGDQVGRGSVIGLSGSTGISTGPHLHFGIKPNENDADNGFFGKVDPAAYLNLPGQESVLGAATSTEKSVKVLTWKIKAEKGETVNLGYSFKAPNVSPQYYTLGAITVSDSSGKKLYEEQRQWQLAVDAYAGAQVKTIEYLLGGGTDTSSRASTNLVYAGASFHTTKGTAGTTSIVIPGTNVSVRNAYLESRYVLQTAVDVTDIDMTFDATPGPNSGTDTRIGAVIQNGNVLWDTSGPTGWMISRADVTSQLSTQDDSEWATGVDVVAATSVTGPAWAALTTKLVITYESDYSTTSHDEIKTVRFPLDSDGTNDTGSTQAACGVSATCTFSYNADIPDLLSGSNANIESVFFELHAISDSATAPSFTPQIQGGTAGAAVSDQEIIADWRDMYVLYQPLVGGSDFLPNTAQKLDIVNGALALNAMGGELVVTYQYSTGAATQTETVRYWAEQDTAENGVTKTAFPTGASNITISNTGRSVKNIWYKVRTAPSAAQTFTVFGNVGGAGELSNAYTLTGTNARAGEAVIIYDMTASAASFNAATKTVAGASQFSSTTGDSEVSAELYVTFTWSGSSGGAQTKTVQYFAGNSPTSSAVATEYHNFNTRVFLPERVTKTHRSTFVEATHMHSDATAIQSTANIVYLNGTSIMSVTPQDDLEAFSRTYSASISAEIFTGDSSPTATTISFNRRGFGVSNTIGVAEELMASDVMVVTYDADFSEDAATEAPQTLRTIEYVLGGGNDTTSRASAVNVYAGSSWNTTKGSAGTVNVEIPGSGIGVRSAYVEARISVSTAVNTTDVDMLFDATPGPNAGTDGRVSPVIQGTYAETSGQGYWFVVRANVGSKLAIQTDSQWNSGVAVVAGLSVTGPATQLNSMKLVITYEQDYNETAHDEIKTVRFPLDSDGTGDTGSTQAACGSSATCTFSYNADIPDLLSASNANIESVFFELHAISDSATAPSFTPQIQGGTAGAAHSDGEALADVRDMHVLYSPLVGGSDFLPNTAQKLDIVNSALALNAVGGELIVTYKFSTGAATQTETIRYFAEQDTAENGVTKTAFTRSSFTISNSGFSVKNLWYKVTTAPSAAQTFTVFGNVGGVGELSNAYTLTGTNARTGEAVIIYDMSVNASSFSTATTTVTGASQFSSATGDTEVGAELYITFTWTGTDLGPQTKTVLFDSATSGGAATTATEYNNFPVYIFLPEEVTKTHRSTYVQNTMALGDATTINNGTITLSLNGISNLSMTTQDDAESFTATRLQEISSTDFSGGSTIAFKRRAFTLTDTYSAADRYAFANQFVVTYDADFAANGPGTPTLAQIMRHGKWFDGTGTKQPFTF